MLKKSIEGAQPFFGNRLDAAVDDIREAIESGELTQGDRLAEFESHFAEYVGTRYAVGVNSGGTALELVLKAISVEGKEVIVPTNTFVASASSVIQAGGRPVFADISEDTLCLNAGDVLKKITARTVGIMMVHMFGLVPPDYIDIKQLCQDRGLFLIEDAAHAHGASISGIMAGNLGDAACFSFYATKIITTGEGGMVTTNRKDIYENLMRLRNHGKSLDAPVYEIVSNNYRLAEIPAILGIHQLEDLTENIKRRNDVCHQYRRRLSGLTGVTLLPEFDKAVHAYWRFPLYLDDGINRLSLQNAMREKHGVRITWMYEPLCHLQPVFAARYRYNKGDFPVAEKCMERLICLPAHGRLTDDDVTRICKGLKIEIANMRK